MRVAVDATPLVGHRTGVGRFVDALLPALEARDDVEVERYVVSRRADELPEGAKRVLVPAGLALRSWGATRGPSLAALFPRADVIHGTNHIAPPTAHTVITVHDCSFVTARELCSPTIVAFGPVVRRVAASGGWIHTPSEHVAVEARALFDTDRVMAVPHGPPSTATVSGERSRTILAIGTLEPRKNLARLVRAFGALAGKDPDVTLVLAGADGPDGDHIRAEVAALDTSARGRVRLAGWVDDAERERLLATASVLAYPSLDEGFGLPMLEAWQHDVAVVAARAGALPEVAAGAALLADPKDVDALADALQHALDQERGALIERGRARLAAFSWEATAEGIAAIYRQAVEHA